MEENLSKQYEEVFNSWSNRLQVYEQQWLKLFPEDKRFLLPLDANKIQNIKLFNNKFYHYFDDLRELALCFMMDLSEDPSVITEMRIKESINQELREQVYKYLKSNVEECIFGDVMVYRFKNSKEEFWNGYFELFISLHDDKYHNPTVIVPKVPEDQMEYIVELAKNKLVNIVVFDLISYNVIEEKKYDKKENQIASNYSLSWINNKESDKVVIFNEIFQNLYNEKSGFVDIEDEKGSNYCFLSKDKKSISELLHSVEKEPQRSYHFNLFSVTNSQIDRIKAQYKFEENDSLIFKLISNENILEYLENTKTMSLDDKVMMLDKAIQFYKKIDKFETLKFNSLYYYLKNDVDLISKYIDETDLEYLDQTDLGFDYYSATDLYDKTDLLNKIDRLLKNKNVLDKFKTSFNISKYENISLPMIKYLFNSKVLSCEKIPTSFLLKRSDFYQFYNFMNHNSLNESKKKDILMATLDEDREIFDFVLSDIKSLSVKETKVISSSSYFINGYNDLLPILKEKSDQVYVDSIFWNAFLTNNFEDILNILKDKKLVLSEDLVDLICFRLIKKKEQFKASIPKKHSEIVKILDYCMSNNLLKNKDLEGYLKKIK